MVGKERSPLNNPMEKAQGAISPLVSEIIRESTLHSDCQKDSSTKARLQSSGDLPELLSIWEQSLQQIDDQLKTLVEKETVRFNHHSVREIREKINNSLVQEESNQKDQDNNFLPEAALNQFVQARPYLDGRTGGIVLRCFQQSVNRLIKARAAGAKESLAEIKKTADDSWGMLPGGSNGRSTRPKQSGDFHRS